MNDARSPIDHVPVPRRWTVPAGVPRARAARDLAAEKGAGAGQGDTRTEAAFRPIRITGLLRRNR